MKKSRNKKIPLGGASTGITSSTRVAFTAMMYSLGMIAITLENFSEKDAARYLERLEHLCKLDGWSEEEILKLVKFKCVGEAYNWFDLELDLI